LLSSNPASVTINGSFNTTTLFADIVTASAPITINDNVELAASVTLNTTGGATAGADITITGTTNADLLANNWTLTLRSGVGDVLLAGVVGGTAPLFGLDITLANDVTFGGDVTTRTGGIHVTTAPAGDANLITLNGNLRTDDVAAAGDV